MLRKSFTTLMFLILTLVILSTGTFANSNTYSKVHITSDPIHPYIHDLMNNTTSSVRLIDENLKDISENVKKEINDYYISGNYEKVTKYLDTQTFTFVCNNEDSVPTSMRSIGTVPFSFTDRYIHSMYNLEMLFTISNQIFVSNDRFSGYTDPLWTINYQFPTPITLYLLSLNPSLINSGYTYRLSFSFVVGVYQYVYPAYSDVVYYHYI